MFNPTRGGNRGGQGLFKWDDVKSDKHRENYLGHSLKASVGRFESYCSSPTISKLKKTIGLLLWCDSLGGRITRILLGIARMRKTRFQAMLM